MQSSTPNLSLPLPSLKQGDARIGVAILTYADTCTLLLWEVLGNAMESGLKRAGVEVIQHGSYFSKVIAVSEFIVPGASRSAAVEALKQTLQDLDLFFRTTMAMESADQVWHTLHGSVLHVQFDKMFLKPEDIAEGRREFDQALAERQQLARVMVDSCRAKQAELEAGKESQPQ